MCCGTTLRVQTCLVLPGHVPCSGVCTGEGFYPQAWPYKYLKEVSQFCLTTKSSQLLPHYMLTWLNAVLYFYLRGFTQEKNLVKT
jgi:hypothetical protein